MLILIYGNDTYRSRQRLHQLRDAFRVKYDKTGINTVLLDAQTMKPEQFHQQFSAQGFLTDKRFLAVSNVLTSGSPSLVAAVRAALDVAESNTDNVIVFYESEDITEGARSTAKKDPKADLQALLLQKAKKERFATLTPDEVSAWIAKEVTAAGGAIEDKAADQLAAAVESDLWSAHNEIEKLVYYAQGRPITQTDIALLVTTPSDDSLFDLTDALGQKNAERALSLLEVRMDAGAEPLEVLRALTWHVRTLLTVRSFLDQQQAPPAVIAKELQIHPFVAQKASLQVKTMTTAQLQASLARLVDLDRTFKTSRVSPLALLDLFLVSFTAA